MAKSMGGDLVLQLLHEFRESQQDYKQFKHEMLDFKQDMLGFKHEMLGFKHEMLGFKHEMLGFKQDMLSFRDVMEVRMDLQQQVNTQMLGYLQHIVKMLQSMGAQVSRHDELLGDHERRLTKLEE